MSANINAALAVLTAGWVLGTPRKAATSDTGDKTVECSDGTTFEPSAATSTQKSCANYRGLDIEKG